jgi:hypothetical protein
LRPLTLALFVVPVAQAQMAAPLVHLDLSGEWPEGLAREVRDELRLALGERDLDIVPETDPRRASASIHLEIDGTSVRIVVDDLIDDKRVERALMLAGDPPDTWSTLIALGADELVRAAWIEMSMRDAPPPILEPPPEVEAIVQEALTPRVAERPLSIGVALASEGYSDGAIFLGIDAIAGWRIDRIQLELAALVRMLAPVGSSLGTIWGAQIGGTFSSYVMLAREGAWSFELAAIARAAALPWIPSASMSAIADAHTAGLFTLAGGVRVIGRIGEVELGLRATAGAPLLAAVASDDRGDVVAARGVELGARLEIGFAP